jgi:hypothetical protein
VDRRVPFPRSLPSPQPLPRKAQRSSCPYHAAWLCRKPGPGLCTKRLSFLQPLRLQEPDCSAENQFSIAGRQQDHLARGSASPAEQPLQANTQEALAPSIPRALARADSRVPAVPQLPARGPVLAHVPDSERAQAPAAHLRPVKPRARSAPVPAAADEASSSTPRPKKAR